MIGILDNHQFFWFRRRGHYRLELGARTKPIARPTHEQYWFSAVTPKLERIDSKHFTLLSYRRDWCSQADHRLHARIRTRHPQPNRRAKRKSGKNQRHMKFCIEPVERSASIVDFTGSLIVLSMAQSGATKVKTQHRESKTV